MKLTRIIVASAFIAAAWFASPTHAGEKALLFGVLNQRNAVLTAEYWNPILDYVSRRSGVRLELKIGKTVQETDQMTERGEFDFIYSNHIFIPRMARAGYRVIARPAEEAIMGQIVVLQDSPVRTVKDLNGKEVAFPSDTAFVAYAVTMDALARRRVNVKPVFCGNQEGAMGRLKAGSVPAASINSLVMQEFASREGIRYRALWTSEKFSPMPIAVRGSVSGKRAKAVRDALVAMSTDPEGRKILQSTASVIQQRPPFGFLTATERDYKNQRDFYKTTVLKGF